MSSFDYSAPAELFLSKPAKGSRTKYRRFATAAEALRYAVEDLRIPKAFGAWLEVGDERFSSQGRGSGRRNVCSVAQNEDDPVSTGVLGGQPAKYRFGVLRGRAFFFDLRIGMLIARFQRCSRSSIGWNPPSKIDRIKGRLAASTWV
jgi:hypothetical protein